MSGGRHSGRQRGTSPAVRLIINDAEVMMMVQAIRRCQFVLALLVIASQLGGCFNPNRVSGDVESVYVQTGALWQQQIYLTFPSIPLTRSGIHEFVWTGVPEEEVRVSLIWPHENDEGEIWSYPMPRHVRDTIMELNPHIRMAILDEEGNVLADREGFARDWRDSGDTIYPDDQLRYRFRGGTWNDTFRLRFIINVPDNDAEVYEMHPKISTTNGITL